MRPTFLIDLDCKPVSALSSKLQPHALKAGDRITLSKAFATPWDVLPKGLGGTVTDVDEAEGIVEITMDGQLPALYLWGNKLILVPFETDDLAEAVVCRQVAPRRSHWLIAGYALAACLSFGFGWLLDPPDVLFHLHTRHAEAMATVSPPCDTPYSMPLVPIPKR